MARWPARLTRLGIALPDVAPAAAARWILAPRIGADAMVRLRHREGSLPDELPRRNVRPGTTAEALRVAVCWSIECSTVNGKRQGRRKLRYLVERAPKPSRPPRPQGPRRRRSGPNPPAPPAARARIAGRMRDGGL